MRIENNKPVVAQFKQKGGNVSPLIFAFGASSRHEVTVEMLPDKNAIYSGRCDRSILAAIESCSVDAYKWNAQTKIFEFDFDLSNEIKREFCSKFFTRTQITNWTEYKWGILKFRYPSNWKVEEKSTSIVLMPPAQTQEACNKSIIIGGEQSCLTLEQEYLCDTLFGLPIYTAINNTDTLDVLQEAYSSATLDISSRDAKTGFVIKKALYRVEDSRWSAQSEWLTQEELNSYLKRASPGTYTIHVIADGYKPTSSHFTLPISQSSSIQFMMHPVAEPPELSNE